MNTEIADLATDLPADLSRGELPVTWYVHKHRCEHEAASWDERRLRVEEPQPVAAPLIAPQLLIKFISCAVALTAALGIIVTLIR